MKVVLLAGGFGSRISEESQFKPKPMIEIGGMPILWHIMKEYAYYGCLLYTSGGAKPPRNVALWQVYAQVTEQKISNDMDKLCLLYTSRTETSCKKYYFHDKEKIFQLSNQLKLR